MMKQTQPRRVLAALLCTLLLALQFTPVLAAEFAPGISSPEQPVISLHWQDQNGELVIMPAQYQGMINGTHAYWLQLTDPFVIQNRLGSIMYTVSDQDEFDIFEPDQTVGINFTDLLDLPMTIFNTTQQRSWILTVSTLPMPMVEPTPELVPELEPTPEPIVEPEPTPEPTLEPVMEPEPTLAPVVVPEDPTQPPVVQEPTAVPVAEPPAPQDTPVPVAEPVQDVPFAAYAEVNVKSEANLRSVAGGTGKDTVISAIRSGTLVHIIGKADVPGSEFPWYRLQVLDNGQPNGNEGYMRGDLLRIFSDEEAAQRLQAIQGGAQATAAPPPTEAPLPTEAPTPEPQATEEPMPEPQAPVEPVSEPTPEPVVDTSVASYAVTLKNANVRNAAGASSPESAIAVLYADDLTYVDGRVDLPESSWYRVQLLEKGQPIGVSGFVRGDLLSLVDEQTARQRLQDAGVQPLQLAAQGVRLTSEALETSPYTGYALTVTKPLGELSSLMLAPGDPNGPIEQLGGDVILYVDSELEVDGVKWYAVHSPVVDARVGYMLASDLIVPVTDEQAQPYLTPAEPTEAPTEAPTQEPVQTEEPSPTPAEVTPAPETPEPATPSPEPTPRIPGPTPAEEGVVERYGYTNVAGVNVRSDLSTSSSTVETVKLGTVLWISEMHKSGSDMWYKVVVMNNGKQGRKGYVLANLVDLMNDEELARYLESQPSTPTLKPTEAPTPTPEPTPVPPTPQPTIYVPTAVPVTQAPPATATPAPIEGHYAITTVNSVPVRGNPNEMAILQEVLGMNTVVFVRTQAYDEQGRKWHLVQHGGTVGYVLDPLLRFLSGEEEKDYISHISTPPPTYTVAPVTSNSPSSYGQVRNDNVNLRSAPSTSASILMTLKKGTLALVMGNVSSENAIWYRVDVSGTVGYLRSDLLNTLTITQVYDLLYNQQNTGSGNSGGSNTSGSGGNVNVTIPSTPKNNGGLADLIAIEGGWTNGIIEGLPFDTASPQPSETPLPSETPDPFEASDDLFTSALPIDDQTQGSQRSPVLLLVAGITLMGGAAGVYGYALHQNNKKKAAARAAAQRAHAAQGGQPGQRRAVTQPVPRDGSPTSTIMGNTGRIPPVGGSKPDASIGAAVGAAGAAASQRPQQQRPGTPGQQTVPPGVNPYARPSASEQPQSPQSRPAQPAQGPVNPERGPAKPAQGTVKTMQGATPPPAQGEPPAAPRRTRSQRPRDEDLDV